MQAYCTKDTDGVKVCARSESGGMCEPGAVPPPTQLDEAAAARKATLAAAEAEHVVREQNAEPHDPIEVDSFDDEDEF